MGRLHLGADGASWDPDESYRTCSVCGGDCEPEPAATQATNGNVTTITDEAPTTPAEGNATTKQARARHDKAVEAAHRFFLRLDNEAVDLDNAMAVFLQSGSPLALTSIKRIRRRISSALYQHALTSDDESIGGNLLLSAAASAQDAAEAGDQPRIIRQRAKIMAARDKLAQEAIRRRP